MYISCLILQEETTIHPVSFKTITNDNIPKEKDLDVLADSLTQQPNLSQG